MADLTNGAHANIILSAFESLRVEADGTAKMLPLYGAPAGEVTFSASTRTFGPYGVQAKIKLTAFTGSLSYQVVEGSALEMIPAADLTAADVARVRASIAASASYGASAITSKAGRRLVVWGDSTADQNNPISGGYTVLGNAWVQKGLYVAGNSLDVVAVGGNSGLRTDQIIPNFAAQVAANVPDFVMLPVCTNDLYQGLGNDVALAGLAHMVALVESIGAVPILCTLFAGGTWASTQALRDSWKAHNANVLAMAAARNLLVFDGSTAFAAVPGEPDPIAGTSDGLHANNLGSEYVSRPLGEFFRRWPRRGLFNPAVVAANIVTNPRMTGTGGSKQSGVTGVVPDGCTAAAVTASVSSVVTRSDGGAGNWWQQVLTLAPGTGAVMYIGTASLATAGLAVGDTFRAVADVELLDGSSNIHTVQLIAQFTGGSNGTAASNSDATNAGIAIAPGVTKRQLRVPEKAIPPGTTAISLYMLIQPVTGFTGACTVRIGAASGGKVA